MDNYLGKSENALVRVEELGPSDVAGLINALAENACDGHGSRKFELIDKRRPGGGCDVAL